MKKIKDILVYQKKLEEKTNKAEQALLVRHNKNLSYDLKNYIDCKRKLIKFNKSIK